MAKSGRVKKGVACAFDGYLNPCQPPYVRVPDTKFSVCVWHDALVEDIRRTASTKPHRAGRHPITSKALRAAA